MVGSPSEVAANIGTSVWKPHHTQPGAAPESTTGTGWLGAVGWVSWNDECDDLPSRNPCISHQIEEIKRIFPTFGWDMYGYVTFWHGKVHRHVFVHVSFFETALTSHTARGCLARMKCVHDIMLGIQRQKFEMDLGSFRRHIKQR